MAVEDELIGTSDAMVALRAQVERLLARQTSSGGRLPPILILGETGVGKGLLVRSLHRASTRSRQPLVEVNCAAIPEHLVEAELFGFERGAFTDARQAKPGLFQAAHGGVLFLDEIGMLPPNAQAKLLTALDQRQVRRLGGTRPETVDAWVLSATNEDLSSALAQGRFRADLYHRISPVTLRVPPLRERGRDVIALAEHFLGRACADYRLPARRLTVEAQRSLLAHPWPGNVRELTNLMERVALLSEGTDVALELLDLPSPAGQRREVRGTSDLEAERGAVQDALEATQWNLSRAAARLGVPRNTLRYRIDRLGLRAGGSPKPVPSGEAPAVPQANEMSALALRWERRWITALRVALTGPTELSEFHLTPTLESLVSKAISFGAGLDDLHPAGFTVFFGLDPMEDAPHRGALAAQAMQMALQRASAEGIVARYAVHVAECLIARGTTASGIDAGERRRVGDVLDALLLRAPAGSTVVSDGGARFLRRAFELQALCADTGQVAAYRVAEHVRAELAAVGRARSPFVGRDRELSQLDDLLTQAESGRGQLVGLVGEPGAGKSRLLYEFRHSVGRGRVTYLEGRCATYGRSTPYLPIVALSRDAFQFSEMDAPGAIAEHVRQELRALGLYTGAVAAYLLQMLGVRDESQNALPPLSPEAMRARIMEALRQVMVASSQRRPLILAIEDLQWIDPTSEEIVGALADSVAACPILLLVTYRHGYQPPWPGKSYATQLVLRRLPRADSEAIVTFITSAPALTREVVERIVTRADGIPFFLEELARAVSEGHAGQVAVTIPETIQDVLSARFDRLPPADRDLLQAAAVLGKEGAVSLLREVAGLSAAGFEAGLARLRAAEFLHETAVVPTPLYTFEHVLTQEVVYRTLTPERRRALHATAANAIERLMPNVADRAPEILAQHCAEGGLVIQAIAYWQRAGQFAFRRSALAEAIEHLTKGLELVETLPNSPDRVQKELGLRVALAAALMATQGFASDQLDATLARAREIVRHLGDSPQLFPVRFGLWRLSLVRAQLFTADEAATGLLEIAERAKDPALLMAANVATGATAFYRGQFGRARSHLERGLSFHEAEFVPTQVLVYGQDLAAGALGYLAATQAISGDLDQAAVRVDRALEMARGCDHPFTLAFGLMLAGNVRQLRGEAALTGRLGEELLTLSREQGFVYFVNIALSLTGWAQATEDPLSRGLDRMLEGARGYEMLHHRLVPAHRTYLAEALVRAGMIDEALDVIQTGLAHASERGEQSHLADLHRVKGDALARLSRAGDAQASFLLAFDIASQQGARLFALRTATALVKLSAGTVGPAPALDRARLAAIYAEFTEAFELEDLRAARQLLDAP